MSDLFPQLALNEWRETRDLLHGTARLLGAIRAAGTPPQKHYWHGGLHTAVSGLSTGPLSGGGVTYALLLDLARHALRLETSRGGSAALPLTGQSPRALGAALAAEMAARGLPGPGIAWDDLPEDGGAYDETAVARFWQALGQIERELARLRAGWRRESSPILLWPHHFDLALSWYSGRLVPGADPADADMADEALTFGFSTGDEGLPEPYVYITAYPQPAGWGAGPLPAAAEWYDGGWQGALLRYAAVSGERDGENGRALLRAFLEMGHAQGQALMGGS